MIMELIYLKSMTTTLISVGLIEPQTTEAINESLYDQNMNESQVTCALAALSQAQRLRAFRVLVVAGKDGLTPTAIAEKLSMVPNTLSFHLKELEQSGLVNKEPRGRNLIYRANFLTMKNLIDFLSEQCCDGNSCELTEFKDCTTSLAPQ